jgi:hypothetical protein
MDSGGEIEQSPQAITSRKRAKCESGSGHMLKMGAWLSNGARPAQTHPANSLGMNTFDACSLGIPFRTFPGLFALARSF